MPIIFKGEFIGTFGKGKRWVYVNAPLNNEAKSAGINWQLTLEGVSHDKLTDIEFRFGLGLITFVHHTNMRVAAFRMGRALERRLLGSEDRSFYDDWQQNINKDVVVYIDGFRIFRKVREDSGGSIQRTFFLAIRPEREEDHKPSRGWLTED